MDLRGGIKNDFVAAMSLDAKRVERLLVSWY